MSTDGPETIVVGVDGSTTSLNALAHALGLARRADARLVVVHVRQVVPGFAAVGDRSGVLAVSGLQSADEVAEELAAIVARFSGEFGVTTEVHVRTGDVAGEIAALATDRRADAVVVGTSHSLGHRLGGSVAGRLCRLARWPVTVVP
ncbi:universal stress protein [Kineococcus sp. NPDC059986]|uniref:universal stress protein n=1 Tax=Kineococcus sp. NPDC059986 TaxID=3155538 RepID=UPI00344E6D58